MIKDVKTTKDVKTFAGDLVKEGISFHPDDDFNDYVNLKNSKPTYSKREAEVRNKLMDKCFKVCNENGVEVYEIMYKVFLKKTGLDKVVSSPSANKSLK